MQLPPARRRPKFAQWRYERGLTLRKTTDMLAAVAGHRICSRELVRTICLPFGHDERTEPSPELAAAISGLTEGEVAAGDWAAPLSQVA